MKPVTTLKTVMLINALSSGATALLLLSMPGIISDLFGRGEKLPFMVVGLFLLVFAFIVFTQSRRSFIHKGWLKFIIALDILWVLESVLILIPHLFRFTTIGYILIAAVALWVAVMALLQARGLKQLTALPS
ncbi:hypothetical protein [Adhaeribacter radiodurans]|uniref:Uncharacterized protein n=1 Tax=Adhaeribacter radiodurans TaxID=2745197 RepID=A0A7L7L947_9BACT|nr:hypothetical protein [Adhaeribacter radiodurans]QMU29356.1 hypothetical protein HUW48_15515 [Adhaeribacter radiodurans]